MKFRELEKLCEDVRYLAGDTGDLIRNKAGQLAEQDIELKGVHDFVTCVDKESERHLVTGLSKLFPEAGFITEEKTIDRKGIRYNWIIDPLDGTTNFIHGLPLYSVSIALKEQDELLLGVIHEANLSESFYSWKGAPSFLNGSEIHVSSTMKVADSLIATGFPNSNYEHMKPYMALLECLMYESHGIRRMGSAAVDLAYVACGRFECFYEYSLNPWDVAAGALIVKNAGGTVTDFKGGNDYLFGREIIASNKRIHHEFLQKLRKYFNITDR